LWHTIHTAKISDTVRVHLEQILELWFFERFKTKTEQEVLTMLQTLTPLEETRAYQNIFAKGMARGVEEGEARGIAKGLARGVEEGEARGIAKGLARGVEEGKAEGKSEG
jgi:predicted transposase YdaD